MTDTFDKSTIGRLIDRFMAGETSLEEEKLLYGYFARTDVPTEFEPYREMFRWYADLGETDCNSTSSASEMQAADKPQSRRGKIFAVFRPWHIAGIAAMIAVVICTMFFFRPSTTIDIPEEYLCYKGSYIIRDGKKITDLNIVVPEIIRIQQIVEESLHCSDDYFIDADDAFINAAFDESDLNDPIIKEFIDEMNEL